MKVYIGPYTNWFGPYQLAEKLMFWVDKDDDRVHKFGMWLAGDSDIDDDGNSERSETILYKFLKWVDSKKKRKVKIRIDKYDTWNMDSTLALLILPMLKQLQATKHGSPSVDDEDVPLELRSTQAPPKKDEYDIDDRFHQRWDWVLNEITWAFEQLQPECDWESQYHSGDIKVKFKKIEEKADGNSLYEMLPNPGYKFDSEGCRKHQERIHNGLKLFGKYYMSLWD